jgi:hypothetical protein
VLGTGGASLELLRPRAAGRCRGDGLLGRSSRHPPGKCSRAGERTGPAAGRRLTTREIADRGRGHREPSFLPPRRGRSARGGAHPSTSSEIGGRADTARSSCRTRGDGSAGVSPARGSLRGRRKGRRAARSSLGGRERGLPVAKGYLGARATGLPPARGERGSRPRALPVANRSCGGRGGSLPPASRVPGCREEGLSPASGYILDCREVSIGGRSCPPWWAWIARAP